MIPSLLILVTLLFHFFQGVKLLQPDQTLATTVLFRVGTGRQTNGQYRTRDTSRFTGQFELTGPAERCTSVKVKGLCLRRLTHILHSSLLPRFFSLTIF